MPTAPRSHGRRRRSVAVALAIGAGALLGTGGSAAAHVGVDRSGGAPRPPDGPRTW